MRDYEEDRYGYSGGMDSRANPLNVLKGMGIFAGLLLGPAFVVAIIIFVIFMRILRWKPSVTIFPLTFIFIILYAFSSPHIANLGNLTSITALKSEWPTVISSYIYISVMMGVVLGYIYILYKVIDLKRYPEYVHISGWAYGFEYAATPLDLLRRKRNKKALREGDEFDYEKAPVGVIEAPVISDDLEGTLDMKNYNMASIVYRYYNEAMEHTLITGKTGSGKALHVDTDIMIKNKGWVTVGDAEVGDILYDENGNYTKLEAIYKPMTPDHYQLTFDNGEIVKACGDHLWNIGDVEAEKTFDTRTLYENFSPRAPYRISHTIDDERRRHRIILIEKINDDPEDYVCFTVDSPSRLFLVTKSYIPTHNTVTMLSLIQNDILVGNPICVIDFKKSPDLIYFLSKWAEENGREFYHFVSGKPGTYRNPYKDDQATYDPLSTGGATAKADMILNLRSWDSASEVFKKRTQDVLQSLFFLLERTPRKAVPNIDWDSGGLAQFVSALDLNNFKMMIEHMAKDMQAGKLGAGDIRRYNTLIDLYKELSSKTKSDLKAQIVELLSIARTLIVSNYGDWLATGASDYHIDLMDVATSSEAPIVLFSFNQQEEPEFAQYIGSIVMSDLSRVSALKNAKGDPTPFGVYIDEFQTLPPMTVKDNLEKARSSKMYITLSLQSIDQIVSAVDSNGEAMANAILDTCANFIFHDGSGYDTAEKMSKIIGKTDKYKYRSTSNERPGILSRLVAIDKAMVSKDIESDWLIPPSEFQSLESPSASNGYKATAYVINKSLADNRFKRNGGASARKVHVVVADETAQGVSNDFKQQIFIPAAKELEFDEIQSGIMMEYIEDDFGVSSSIEDSTDGDWIIEDNIEDNTDEQEISEDEFNRANRFAEMMMGKFTEENNQNTQSSQREPESSNVTNDTNKSPDAPIKKETSQLDMFNQLRNQTQNKDNVEKKENEEKSKKAEVKNDSFSLPELD